MDTARSRSLPLWILAVVATLAALKLGAAVLAPIVVALVLGVVLSPLSSRIDRLGAPPALSAFLTLLTALLLFGGLFAALEPILSDVIEQMPRAWAEVREIIASVRSAVRSLDDLSDEVSALLSEGPVAVADTPDGGDGSSDGSDGGGDDEVSVPTIWDALLYAPGLAATVLIFVGTLYFFLLARREVYDWISGSANFPLNTADMLEAEREVSRYFLTITLINGGFGLLITGVLMALGMPYAPLWGFAAFLVNFVLYLGPAAFAVALLLGGIVAFEGPISFAPAAAYVLLNATEGQFVTPSLVGRQMSVNPLMVFLSLVGWLWLWGPLGGVIAIPVLVWGMVLYKRGRAAQTISSGTPGRLRPNLLAGADG